MKILYIEGCNYLDFPVGGQLSFARQMIKVFGKELDIVGISTDNKATTGKWSSIIINDNKLNFFSLFATISTAKKPIIPRRLQVYGALKKYKTKILRKRYDFIFTRSPEIVMAIENWKNIKKVYYFAGVGNPLAISRFWYGRVLSVFYDDVFFSKLKKYNLLMAAADDQSILETVKRSKGCLNVSNIIKFPTRIDTNIFRKNDKLDCRKRFGIPQDKKVIVTTGRLHWAKGWDFLLDSYQIFLKSFPDTVFYFIGDGNSRPKIEKYISENGLSQKVFLKGFQFHEVIADFLSAADLYVMGSLMEGWATSLVEAKGCCVPICTTDFSSATEIVTEGVDGIVVKKRDPIVFAKNMREAMELKIDTKVRHEEMRKYSVKNLREDLVEIFDRNFLHLNEIV
jgi:glycosyltransferase involved in cell wall biosynthesis